jgi:hypothetical protein
VSPRLPPAIQALLLDLRLDRNQPPALAGLDPAGWQQVFCFTDDHGITLLVRDRLAQTGHWNFLPVAVRERLDRNLTDNLERLRRCETALGEVAAVLKHAGLEFLLLKGLTHSPDFVENIPNRVPRDFDIYLPVEMVYQARDALVELGFEPVSGFEKYPLSHLPTMVRKSGWTWRGNYFDPAAPFPVELHYRFWQQDTERLKAPGLEEFWNRRGPRSIAGISISCLALPDQLGYAALHALRHLFRGSLKLLHVYEIACFLDRRRSDLKFWERWREWHAEPLRGLESIIFRLAENWFGASRPPLDLPEHPAVEAWMRQYAWSPLEANFHPNKNEIYLHWGLLDSPLDRLRVARRRLLPGVLPRGGHGSRRRDTAFLISRLVHHARVLAPTLCGLARWRSTR